MMSIQIPLFKVYMSHDVSQNLEPVLNSGMITQGKKVEEFENRLRDYFSFDNILTLNSATSGLTLGLRLLDLNPEDEVLSCPLTCTATNFPILSHNLKIKWVDVDEDTCNMDLDDLKNKITQTTKCVVIVFWGGYPVDLEKVEDIKKYTYEKYGNKLHIIYDCAHAFGSIYKNKFIGTHSYDNTYGENISVFSLQAIKHLTTGDGGLMFLQNKDLYNRAKLLRWYGIDREQRSGGNDFRLEKDIPHWGYKFHMNDISATIGISNLKDISNNISRIRENANFFKKELGKISGVTLLKERGDIESSYWIFTIKIINKYEFIEFMKNKGVVVSQVHNRNDIHSCLQKFKKDLPKLDRLEKRIVSIPVGWWVTNENRQYIVDCIGEWCCKYTPRLLEYDDYNKGFLKLMEQLNNYKEDISFDVFKFIQSKIRNQEGYVFVVEENNKIIASAKILIEYKTYNPIGHIEDVVVHSEYRHKGLGSILIDRLKLYGKSMGCYKIVLSAKKELTNFYESNGFSFGGESFVNDLKGL